MIGPIGPWVSEPLISLSAVLEKQHPLLTQIMVVTLVSFLATIGVYGIVALIVRMDDAGFRLVKVSHNKGFLSTVGKLLINLLPLIIKALSIIGTIALVMVSGGIFVHNIEYFHHLLPNIPSLVKEIILGLAGGLIVIMVKALLEGTLRAVKRLGNKA